MAQNGSVGLVETRYCTLAHPPDGFELDCGQVLSPVTLAYETYGELNASKSNAVLILHALSGNAHAAGRRAETDPKPGWWDAMIGPGKAFDTQKYFVICSNILGGCGGSTGPSSINPKTGRPYGLSFPIVTINDMVRAQTYLVADLGIEKLLAVVGGSMGGMQALAWATDHPDMVQSAIVIASAPLNGAQAIAFDAVGRNAIMADPDFRHGDYYGHSPPAKGLSIARMLAHITYLSDESMRLKFGRSLRKSESYSYDFESEFSVETYLDHQGEEFVNRFDANSYLYITKAIDYFDLTAHYGALDAAMARVSAKMMILSYSSDWLYPPYQSQEMAYALLRQRRKVSYCNIQSDYGHDAFLLEVDVMHKLISGFLDHAMHPDKLHVLKPAKPVPETPPDPSPASTASIYTGRRVDYDLIVNLVDAKSRVLDIGCGDGELLKRLTVVKQVDAMGIELSQNNVIRCVLRGIPVVQADADEGLSAIPDQSYDFVILSMTLQVVARPEFVINEMVRVGQKAIVSFPNFGYWKNRIKTLLLGRAPVTRSLPYAWHSSPNRHVLSIRDFRMFCAEHFLRIEREIPLSNRGTVRFLENVFAEEAVFVISRSSG